MSSDPGPDSELPRREDSTADPTRLFPAMASRRSRLALACLHEHDDPVSLAELADEVAATAHGRPLADVRATAVGVDVAKALAELDLA